MKQNNHILFAGIVFLIVFIALSIAIQGGLFQGLDLQSMIGIQKYIPRLADTPLSFFSLLGSFEITTIILCIVLFMRKRKTGIITLGFYGLGLIIELLGKNFIYHPGPPGEFSRYDLGFTFPTSLYQTGYSSPSGHAFRTAFLITIFITFILLSNKISQQKKYMITVLLLGIFCIMMISRVSLGEHWLSDVMAGSTLGTGLALLSLTPLFPKRS